MILESISNPSMTVAGDKVLIESPESHLNPDESIFLVGEYDGVSWSSALHSFSPSNDVLRSLRPMSSVRAYASVARLDGELYVLGGATGSMWYDTGIAFASLYPLSAFPSHSLSLTILFPSI